MVKKKMDFYLRASPRTFTHDSFSPSSFEIISWVIQAMLSRISILTKYRHCNISISTSTSNITCVGTYFVLVTWMKEILV